MTRPPQVDHKVDPQPLVSAAPEMEGLLGVALFQPACPCLEARGPQLPPFPPKKTRGLGPQCTEPLRHTGPC